MYIDLVSIFHRLYNFIDLLVHYIHGYLVSSSGEVDFLGLELQRLLRVKEDLI